MLALALENGNQIPSAAGLYGHVDRHDAFQTGSGVARPIGRRLLRDVRFLARHQAIQHLRDTLMATLTPGVKFMSLIL